MAWETPIVNAVVPSAQQGASIAPGIDDDPVTVVEVDSEQSLRQVLKDLGDRTVIKIRPGRYRGGWQVNSVSALTVEASDPARPPLFEGGNTGWQFSRCPNLTLRNLKFKGQRHNGLNIDDGGRYDRPVNTVTVENLTVSDIGPSGNFDAIKLSGLQQVTIRGCDITGWGGQAIDMVGCHQVEIQRCEITGKPGFTQHTGIQCKGGSRAILIDQCFFRNAGLRPVNAGGSTDRRYFRPQDANYEARDVTIQSCLFVGAPCACAFVGVDGAKFIGNRINYPEKWVFRILQETTDEGFVPCRNVIVADNRIVFKRESIRTAVNIGANTQPSTFQFRGNHWFAEDQPEQSRPELPVAEIDGIYGQDPREHR